MVSVVFAPISCFVFAVFRVMPNAAFPTPSPLVALAGTRTRSAKATSGMTLGGHCFATQAFLSSNQFVEALFVVARTS